MLANMAMNKIHSRNLHELVDPRLGHHSDCRINGMITQVAALALQCLQQDREMRPRMTEVLETLKEIERGGRSNEEKEEDEEEKEEGRLLKRIPPYSPNSVTDPWASTSSTMSSFRESGPTVI
ncbi:hypothetical protein HPP92_021378 [Vanilla planifolia]|uniref:Uncharacterized protein n=1 Tax=Vanilla planifolia TaxID=51239 RepID=A0A835Q4Q3_VANPL|nr:hypothetical protein HPP92_021378 [Vanilla planifolia]